MPTTYEPIATQNLSSAASSITFSSIPATYTDLRLSFTCTAASVGQDIALRYNGDSSSSYYQTHLSGQGSAASSGQFNSTNWRISYIGVYTDTSIPITMQTDIFSYINSNYKIGLSSASGDKNGSGYVARNVGLWLNSSAITSLTLSCAANFSIGSTATLYGIKNA